jgi:transposase-like protein
MFPIVRVAGTPVPLERLQRVEGLAVDVAAARLDVSRSTIKRWRRQVRRFDA